MSSLTKQLRKEGYDLADGSTRRYKLLQVWLKKNFNSITLEYENISHALKSDIQLNEIETPALTVNSTIKNEYNFNIGISMLNDVLISMGLQDLDISSKIKKGKGVSISYDNAITREIAIGELRNFISNGDFLHPNQNLLQNLNRNNFIVINGVLLAKNLIVEIETDVDLSADVTAKLKEIADGKLDFDLQSNKKIKMVADNNNYFPIAVQAHRMDYDKGEFKDLILVTDNNIDLFK